MFTKYKSSDGNFKDLIPFKKQVKSMYRKIVEKGYTGTEEEFVDFVYKEVVANLPKEEIGDRLGKLEDEVVKLDKKEVEDVEALQKSIKANTELGKKIEKSLKSFAPIDSPEFINSISMGRDNNSSVGIKSVALGEDVIASGICSYAEGRESKSIGDYSHAEGAWTIASGSKAHAEGCETKARGGYSHAEGCGPQANGDYSHAEGDRVESSGCSSHAEGFDTKSVGDYSHAEGYHTTAASMYQHVQGKSNIEDTENKYAHIVGNGVFDDYYGEKTPSNAHTLDWYGNAWFAGNVYIGGIGQDDAEAKQLVTTDYVDHQVREAIFLKDTINGYDYVVQMQNGSLVSFVKTDHIEIRTPPTKTDYTDTDIFDPTGMAIIAVSQDGSEKEISDYVYDKYVTVESNIHTIIYVEAGIEYTAEVFITTRTLEQALADFTYTTNDDGSYTITGWRGTLNGVTSTEMIFPNSNLVIL